MSRYYVCCDKCVESIGKHSTLAARVWLDLCALLNDLDFKEDTVIVAQINDFPELRLLERMGFVTTTETNRFIMIKMHGYQKDDGDADFFCIREGEHE